MSFPVRAITLDLDDTVWPFAPIGERIEQALHAWLREHCPRTAKRFPIPAMRKLRLRVYEENTHLAHDMSALRRLCIERALRDSGDDVAHLDAAYEVFFAARNEVECYPDSVAALERIAERVPIAALTNGNADLARVGLQQHFVFQLGAGEHGKAKPSPCIFHAACDRLDCDRGQVLHVGDHIETDVAGAARAGLKTCWINRDGRRWRHDHITPDLEFDSLAGLADWLDAAPRQVPDRSTTA